MSFLSSADIIRKMRREKGWSQTRLARIAQIKQSQVSDYEQGKQVMSADRFLLLLKILGGELRL